jgi:hypothetical protein
MRPDRTGRRFLLGAIDRALGVALPRENISTMKIPALLALATLGLASFGCSSTSSTSPAPTATVSPPPPPPPTASAEAKAPEEKVEPPPADKPADPPPAADPAPAGRLAFITCEPASRQVKGCTKEMKPVCGQVDTGIRCIKAPCPSSEPRTFSNACMACLDPKVTGYFARSCEDINSGKAP